MKAQRNVLFALLFGFFLLLLPAGASQADETIRYVAPSGTDSGNCSNPSTPCRTVQYAINQATAGDTVKIAASTYTSSGGQVISIDKSITLIGGYAPSDWTNSDPQANATILDGQNARRVVYISGGSINVTLQGLQIVNGRSNEGGGIYFSGLTLLLTESRIISNTATRSGGGIYLDTALGPAPTVTITNNVIQDNNGTSWGGGAYTGMANSYVAYNVFEHNTATYGGGMEVVGGNLTLTNNTFLNNVGGGLVSMLNSSGQTHTITQNLFQGNVGSGTGGGVMLWGQAGSDIVFSHNRVLDNIASSGNQPSRGGGLWVSGPARITDNLIQGNWANDNPNSAGSGGGLSIRAMDGPVWVEKNRILNNRASKTGDWGIYYPAYGGGVHIEGADGGNSRVVTMTNNIVAGNLCCANCWGELYFTDGCGIYVGGQTSPELTQLYLYHNTIADNATRGIRNESARITMNSNILFGHERNLSMNMWRGTSPAPIVTADYTLWYPAINDVVVHGTFVHTNDFIGAPGFVSSPADNYHLGATSAAIDKGPGTGVTTDIDGDARPFGAAYDLGADECALQRLYLPLILR